MNFKNFKSTRTYFLIRKLKVKGVQIFEKQKQRPFYKKYQLYIENIYTFSLPSTLGFVFAYIFVEGLYWAYNYVLCRPTLNPFTPKFLDKGYGWKHSIIPPHLEPWDLKGSKEFHELNHKINEYTNYEAHLRRFHETDHPQRESSRIIESALYSAENEKVLNEVRLETMNRAKSKGITNINLNQIRTEKAIYDWKKDFSKVNSILIPYYE